MSQAERAKVIEALIIWAKSAPEEPVIGFIGGGAILTPREIVRAVQQETEDGQAILEILEHGIRREGIDMVLNRFHGLPAEA
ncbi:hypothetical protein [Bryobacter aggregatus]|uniref:hypothetical protein n=1 Tax=Bryobacter aggregatus TaxID=360054 RepID=UPI0004E0E2AB|nr:hypothetical protein [Bryobacter aggregatus]